MCSHFVVTKTIQIIGKARLCHLQRDVPQSYARIGAGVQASAVQDVEEINASINNGAVNMKKRQQRRKPQRLYRSIHCEVEFGVWKFIQVDFTPLISAPLGG